MTDRELLELAAKAAGMEGWRFTGSGMAKMLDPSRPEATGSIGADWNPLTDDGDALRLAVRLSISVSQNIVEVRTGTIGLTLAGIFIKEDSICQGGDIATRRSIVRAAAEIGRSLP